MVAVIEARWRKRGKQNCNCSIKSKEQMSPTNLKKYLIIFDGILLRHKLTAVGSSAIFMIFTKFELLTSKPTKSEFNPNFMFEMATRAHAKQLGLIQTIKVGTHIASKCNQQKYDFLYVLDFESTCWDAKDPNRRAPEIIEFSMVLYDIHKREIIDEFQQYVMPTENPKLSEFCRNFSGISQQQVDNGVSLATCLTLCLNWIKKHAARHNLLLSVGSDLITGRKLCVFVTWTDWDLGTCLTNECKRKNIQKPCVFNEWLDLKALYIDFYKRRPKGLQGALSELGLNFEGDQHCGLHDARNTAKLAAKMIADGVCLFLSK